MTFAELIAQFRIERDDAALPYLWPDAEVILYLNEAINEACERALLIEDSTTTACCKIDLIAGQSTYDLHASIISGKRVTYDGRAIDETSVEALDNEDSRWESRTGHPCQFIAGEKTIRIVPIPTADTIASTPSIYLTVYRRPLLPFTTSTVTSTTTELPAVYHHRFLPWAYSLALRKVDTEAYDRDEADKQAAIFEASFGARPDANVQRKRRDKRPPVTRMYW